MRRTVLFCYALVWAACACAAAPSFEVATIRPADPNTLPRLPDGSTPEALHYRTTATQIDYRSVTLRMLLQRAYDLNPAQISGPNWFDDDKYDVVAQLPSVAITADVPVMLQQLLTERFHLALHRDKKTLKIYEITVAKGGPKFTPAEPAPKLDSKGERLAAVLIQLESAMKADSAQRVAGDGPRSSRGSSGAAVTSFLKTMSAAFDRPLKDSTGITGTYDFRVFWSTDPTGSPSIFAAFEDQLGLKVQPANEEMEYLVIDSASRTPDAN